MITFTSRQKEIRNADLITRKAHSVYPHISESRVSAIISKDKVKELFWGQMSMEYALKFAGERLKMECDEKNLYAHVIEALKNGLGNCAEEAKLAELIGKINGIKNIYSGSVFAGRGFAKHDVAFITNEEIKPNKKYKFKKKDALIIDPWLGITEFAGNYFKIIKTNFAKLLEIRGNSKPYIIPDFTSKLTQAKIRNFRKKYSELIIDFSNKKC